MTLVRAWKESTQRWEDALKQGIDWGGKPVRPLTLAVSLNRLLRRAHSFEESSSNTQESGVVAVKDLDYPDVILGLCPDQATFQTSSSDYAVS